MKNGGRGLHLAEFPLTLFTPIFYKTLYLANLKSKNIGGLKIYATPPKLNV